VNIYIKKNITCSRKLKSNSEFNITVHASFWNWKSSKGAKNKQITIVR